MAIIKETGEKIVALRGKWDFLKFRVEEEGRSACFLIGPGRGIRMVTYASIEEILLEGWEPCGGDGVKNFLFKRWKLGT